MKGSVHSIVIVLLGGFLWMACDTEGNVEPDYKQHFIKFYGEDGDQEGKDLVVNGDGSMIILGTSNIGGKRIYLVKTDAEGNVLWKKTLGTNFIDEVAQDIEQITAGPDAGNFVVLSNVRKNLDDSLAIRLTIIAPNGDSLKSVLFNQLESQEAKSVTPLSDGGYYVAGKTTDYDPTKNPGLPPPDIEDIIIIRFSSALALVRVDAIGGSHVGSGIKIFQSGSTFYYAGYSDEKRQFGLPIDDNYEPNFVFTSFVTGYGTPEAYVGNDTDAEELNFVAQSVLGNYLAIGTQFITGDDESRLYAVIMNSNFTVSREATLESDVVGVSISPSSDGQFLVLGNKIRPGGRDIWLGKVGQTLNIEFSETFGGSNNDDMAAAVAELPNGDIMILGTMNLINQNKMALIKLKANGKF